MTYMATITSKKQLTLPAEIYRTLGLKEGQKVIVSEENGNLIITPAEKLVKDLAGSLSPLKKWQGKSSDEIIELSKKEYFKGKKE